MIIVAVLLMVVLLLLAVLVDGARLLQERQELIRVADAAGKAGLIPVGDHMVTQVVNAQTAAATQSGSTPAGTNTPGPTPTPTPDLDDFFGWLNADHRKTLVAPPMRTVVATQVRGYAERNDRGPSHPEIQDFQVDYPHQYQASDPEIQVQVRIHRKVAIIFASLLGLDEGVITGESKQGIPQR